MVPAAYRVELAVDPGQGRVLEIGEFALVEQRVQAFEDLEGERVEGFTAEGWKLVEGGKIARGEPQNVSPLSAHTAFRRGQIDFVLLEVRPEQNETGGGRQRSLAGQPGDELFPHRGDISMAGFLNVEGSIVAELRSKERKALPPAPRTGGSVRWEARRTGPSVPLAGFSFQRAASASSGRSWSQHFEASWYTGGSVRALRGRPEGSRWRVIATGPRQDAEEPRRGLRLPRFGARLRAETHGTHLSTPQARAATRR